MSLTQSLPAISFGSGFSESLEFGTAVTYLANATLTNPMCYIAKPLTQGITMNQVRHIQNRKFISGCPDNSSTATLYGRR